MNQRPSNVTHGRIALFDNRKPYSVCWLKGFAREWKQKNDVLYGQVLAAVAHTVGCCSNKTQANKSENWSSILQPNSKCSAWLERKFFIKHSGTYTDVHSQLERLSWEKTRQNFRNLLSTHFFRRLLERKNGSCLWTTHNIRWSKSRSNNRTRQASQVAAILGKTQLFTNTFFTFEGKVFKQRNGIAMGTTFWRYRTSPCFMRWLLLSCKVMDRLQRSIRVCHSDLDCPSWWKHLSCNKAIKSMIKKKLRERGTKPKKDAKKKRLVPRRQPRFGK